LVMDFLVLIFLIAVPEFILYLPSLE